MEFMSLEKITIIGGGSMGTALGKMLAEKGMDITMWVYEPDLAKEINRKRENDVFLSGFSLPENLKAVSSFADALKDTSLVISATPSQVLGDVWREAVKYLPDNAVVVSASKGIETGTLRLMSQVLRSILPGKPDDKMAFLSGPSFAVEIAKGFPTACVIASKNIGLAEELQKKLTTPGFRLYTTDDVVGVEMGGALKNVIAIGVGVAEGMNLGFNSKAALITRGLAEISRLAVACGANPLTLAGLAGTGDLVLTCTGNLSRNLQVGIKLGKGVPIEKILNNMNMVAEGVETTKSACRLSTQKNVEMPISETVLNILSGKISPSQALSNLMSRSLKKEREF